MRVGDKIIHAVGGALVPDAHLVHLPRHDEAGKPVGIGAVGVVKIPHIADGRMAVADMHGIRPGDNTLGAGRAGRQHKVVLGQIERLKRGGHQWQHGLVELVGKRHLLEPAGADIVTLEPFGHIVGVVHKGVDDSIGENVLHSVHNAVAAGIADEPVVDDGNFRFLFAHDGHSCSVTRGALLQFFVVDHLAAEHRAEDDLDIQRHGPVFDGPACLLLHIDPHGAELVHHEGLFV